MVYKWTQLVFLLNVIFVKHWFQPLTHVDYLFSWHQMLYLIPYVANISILSIVKIYPHLKVEWLELEAITPFYLKPQKAKTI